MINVKIHVYTHIDLRFKDFILKIQFFPIVNLKHSIKTWSDLK